MAVERRAIATWQGDLIEGAGRVELTSGAVESFPVTWAARTESSDGKTSPEELIAAAHAACFAMSLSNELAKAGSPPERLDVTATSTFDKKQEGWRVTGMHLEVRGDVPGMDAAEFEKHAQAAKVGCPVSNALSDSVEITVKATFA
jgi:osmotically inducible protein OsmC